jgi:tetratricopeptide (TPR) repeat protein
VFISPLSYAGYIEGGFKGFCADVFYLKGVLSITDELTDKAAWLRRIQDNFAAALLLDNRLIQAYFFAGIVCGRTKNDLKQAIVFLKKYRALNPLEWKIPYWIGFDYLQGGDYLSAVQWYETAAALPGAPAFLKSNQVMLYYKAGLVSPGIAYIEGLLETIKDENRLEWITLKLAWLKNIVVLEQKAAEFKETAGRYPQQLEELVEKGLIAAVPEDPFGSGYYFEKGSGRVKSRFGVPR